MDEPHFAVPEDAWTLLPADHNRVIIHLDADCFYAQVEMVRDSSLRDKPLGVKQKNLMVTSNYVARSLGVKKSMWIKEALEALPDLILVDGSDLTHYRQFSSEISAVARTFTTAVERLGLDENFVDVTEILGDYLGNCDPSTIEGHVYGDKEPSEVLPGDPCGCGCQKRLIAGALVAKKLRQEILKTTGITCCAGVAHNKLLAKLVCGYYKPNQQTIIFPWLVHQLMSSLDLVRSIPGIGSSTRKTLEELGIFTVKDLQNSSLTLLHSKFDNETSKRLKDLSFGIDDNPVRKSGRPQTIGLEDTFRKVNTIEVVQTKYFTLLERLLNLLKEDGRIPATLRVCVRKFDPIKFGNRESRQAPVRSSLFASGVQNIGENTRTTLMNQVMELFHKMVDTKKDFHLTMLSIGFSKLIERATCENSISRFFLKRKRSETEDQNVNKEKIEDSSHVDSLLVSSRVSDSFMSSSEACLGSCPAPHDCTSESVTNIHTCSTMNIKDMFSKSHYQTHEEKTLHTSKGKSSKDIYDRTCVTSEEATGSDSDGNHLNGNSYDTSSPLKYCTIQNSSVKDTSSDKDGIARAPHGIDQEVFQALPPEIQDEIILSHKRNPPHHKPRSQIKTVSPKTTTKIKTPSATLDKYFKRNSALSSREAKEKVPKEITKVSNVQNKAESVMNCSSSSDAVSPPEGKHDRGDESVSRASSSSSPTTLQPPDGVDPGVFTSLPTEIQLEIVEERRRSLTSRVSQPPSHSGRRREAPSIMKFIKKV